MINLGEIVKARYRIQPFVHNTPLMLSETLSQAAGCEVYVKLESLQKTGAFKVRGIYNKILQTDKDKASRGFVTASSGNHGLGLAYVCREQGLSSTVVVPEYTPQIKVQAISRQGAKVVLHGHSWNESFEQAQKISAKQGCELVHPFDDDAVINGQGTIALEILEEFESPTKFIASIGGGSMIASNSLVFKELSPKTSVIGLQTIGADAMYQSVQAGRLIKLDKLSSIVESFGTKEVSEKTFSLSRQCVDQILRVTDESCKSAAIFMLERSHVLLELSASICVAALLNKTFDYDSSDKIVMIFCGGNYDLSILANDINYYNQSTKLGSI